MTVSIFIGTSIDGFIARPNGELDWLPEGGGESHGYDEFMASVDALVMGRHSFEKVLTFGAWLYGSKRVVVLSNRPVDYSEPYPTMYAFITKSPSTSRAAWCKANTP